MALPNPQYLDLVRHAGAKYGVPADLLAAQLQSESNFDPNAVSPAGAQGIGQFMPGTWSGSWNPYNSKPATDPTAAIPAAALYLSRLNQQLPGGWNEALAGYNAGPGAVQAAGGVPDISETQNYIRTVNARRARFPGLATSDPGGTLPGAAASAQPERQPAGSPTHTALPHPGGGAGFGSSLSDATNRQAFLQSLVDQTAQYAHLPDTLQVPLGEYTSTPSTPAAPTTPPSVADQHDLPVNTTGGYPFATHGKIIGTPYTGTHTLGNWESDNAIDIAAKPGTPIYAIADGTIGDRFGALGSGNPRFAGLRLHLIFANGKNEAYFAHLSKFADGIAPGVRVRKGELIGYSGEANGVGHLHLGLKNGNVEAYG